MGRFLNMMKREGAAVVLVLGVLAAGFGLAVMTPQHGIRQGLYSADIRKISAGSDMTGRPLVRAEVIDTTGRVFWVRLPASTALTIGDRVEIGVSCKTPAFEKCSARYLPPNP